MTRRIAVVVCLSIPVFAAPAQEPRAPIALTRTPQRITIDGDLSDAGWRDATVIDRFYETSPGDNI
jgi:hypothetical protein